MNTKARLDAPHPARGTLEAGLRPIHGVAFSGTRSLGRIEAPVV